jgi:glycosyltransferase involved in cell wall biosynthesis
MKIGFYSPYFDSISGGERYLLTLASHWSTSHDVFVFWDDPKILEESEKRLHIDLGRVRAVENVFKTKNVFKKLAVTRGYDLLFFLTDGSIPTTFARRNILHFQVPFQSISVHPIKLNRFGAIVCNSRFTKKHLDPRIGKRSIVIYPPVEPIQRTRVVKKKMILSVGRFHPLKKQDVLIEAFRKGAFKDYTLILSGGLQVADKKYFDRLTSLSKKLSVALYPNVSFEKLTTLYNEAFIYWHAAGFGETKPEHMEHFGISTVEAMSAGAVPVVYNGGGLPEIIHEGENGYLWTNVEELSEKTKRIIAGISGRISTNAKVRSEDFSPEIFTASFDRLLASITK